MPRDGGRERTRQDEQGQSTAAVAGASTTADAGATLRSTCRIARISGLIGLAIALLPIPAVADYLLHRGDGLEIDVSGEPALSRRVSIDDNGKIYLPLIEGLNAAGLSVAQLQLKVRDLLLARNLQNPEVTVKIVEYQPVYVDGAVTYPGSYSYHPGLTVREVVAQADGYDIVQRPETARLSGELVSQALRAERLQAALEGRTQIDITHLPTVPITPANLSEIVAVETQRLKAEQDDNNKEKAHLEQMIQATREEIAALEQARQEGTREVAQLRGDASNARQMLGKGMVQWTRVLDQQQALSGAEFRLFDVTARATGARIDLEKLARQWQKTTDERRVKNLQELETTLLELATTQLRLSAQREGRPGRATMREESNGDRAARQFLILRKTESDNQQRIAADESAELLPGDWVEVSEKTASAPAAAPARAESTTNKGPRH